jgi:hypothetical protein
VVQHIGISLQVEEQILSHQTSQFQDRMDTDEEFLENPDHIHLYWLRMILILMIMRMISIEGSKIVNQHIETFGTLSETLGTFFI